MAGLVACMEEKGNAFLVEKSKRKRQNGRSRLRLENRIKTLLKKN